MRTLLYSSQFPFSALPGTEQEETKFRLVFNLLVGVRGFSRPLQGTD